MKHDNRQDGYYWVLLLNSGIWQIAKYVKSQSCFLLINDTKQYYWEHMGQIGNKIPSNYELSKTNHP